MRLILAAMLATTALTAVDAREISGHLAYRERIALAPDAVLVVELSGSAGVVAEVRLPSGGAQVPLPFTITAPDDGAYALQGALFVGGRPVWVSPVVPVAGGAGPVDLGLMQMQAHVPMGFTQALRCGDVALEVGFLDDTARLRAAGATFVLPPVEAASGAKFSDGASPETSVWSKGDSLSVVLQGTDLGECLAAITPPPAAFTARGNEPFWRLDLTAETVTYEGNMGATRIEGARPVAEPAPEGLRYRVSDDLTFTVAQSLCRDTMTGMPHPLSVTVAQGGQTLAGCGGDPVDLLAGLWTVTDIGGAPVPGGVEVTMSFNPDEARVSGAGGCNRYNGGFTLSGEGLMIGPAMSTMMACPDAQMQAEQGLFLGFEQVGRFDIAADGALELIGPAAVAIRAVR